MTLALCPSTIVRVGRWFSPSLSLGSVISAACLLINQSSSPAPLPSPCHRDNQTSPPFPSPLLSSNCHHPPVSIHTHPVPRHPHPLTRPDTLSPAHRPSQPPHSPPPRTHRPRAETPQRRGDRSGQEQRRRRDRSSDASVGRAVLDRS